MKHLPDLRKFFAGVAVGACLAYDTEPLITCYIAFMAGMIFAMLTAAIIWADDPNQGE